ncbi:MULTISPECIES: hypothetical protein [Streptococcus]|uniref:hypothetical protein n=1 Tax=Streptococcus TaxID=1301 RepID=UPI0003F9038E|nr:MULTISPECIES: hypothetical protein [Streptococcus]MCW1017550.1 hypothetical protein [Streptococcus anginosus]MDU6599566.1 hypothetical protein [Streptococcus anginosus]
MKKIDLLKCLSIITKDGLRTKKFKNSHLKLISSAEEETMCSHCYYGWGKDKGELCS